MKGAAFQATFADFRNVKTRGVLQLIFELPVEGADAALEALGGVPRSDKAVWVAIARLDPTKAAREPVKPLGEPMAKERRRFDTLSGATQAGIRCDDPAFQRFLAEIKGFAPETVGTILAAELVREYCGVQSRSELVQGTRAGGQWDKLNDKFLAWMNVSA